MRLSRDEHASVAYNSAVALVAGGFVGAATVVLLQADSSAFPFGLAVFGLALFWVVFATVAYVGGSFPFGSASWNRWWEQRVPLTMGVVIVSLFLTGLPFSPTRLAPFLLLGLWLVDLFFHPGRPWRPSVFLGLNLLLGCIFLLSILGRPPLGLYEGLKPFGVILATVLVVEILDDSNKVRLAVKTLIIGGFVAALAGLVQIGLSRFFGIDRTLARTEAGFGYLVTSSGAVLRASAFTPSPNQFGGLIAVVSLVTLVFAIRSSSRQSRRFFLVATLVMLAAVAFTFARGAWFACLAGLAVLPFILWPRRSVFFAGTVLLCLLGLLGGGIFIQTIQTAAEINPSSALSRWEILTEGLQVLAENKWRGVGIGYFQEYYSSVSMHAHHAPLMIGHDTGLPGLFVFLGLHMWIALRLAFATSAATGTRRTICTALLAGLVPLWFQMQMETIAYTYFWWIYMALGESASASVLGNSHQLGIRYGPTNDEVESIGG